MKIAAFSDTHGWHKGLLVPDADLAVFAGDFMTSGYKHSEVKSFGKWFSNLPHKFKILVAGNHDRMMEFDRNYCLSKFSSEVIYLEDSYMLIDGLKIWGSPWTPWFYDWAFNARRGEQIKQHWDLIPADTDVLITHGPPYGIGDYLGEQWKVPDRHVGCETLSEALLNLKPKVHIFGHIHAGYGVYGNRFNVSICNEGYRPVNPVTVIEWPNTNTE